MTLRLSAEEDRALSFLAAAQGLSKQQAAVRAIVATAARAVADDQIRALAQKEIATYAATATRMRRAR